MHNGLISHLYFKDSSNFSNTFRPFNDSHSSCTPHVIMIDSFFPRCVSQRFDKIFTKIRNCRMANFAIYIFKKRFRNESYKILLEKLGNTVRVFLPKFSNARASQFRSPTGSWNRGGRGGVGGFCKMGPRAWNFSSALYYRGFTRFRLFRCDVGENEYERAGAAKVEKLQPRAI